jgi:hypothetical protein
MDLVTRFSIPAQDVERAAAFCNDVFGWHVQPPTKEDDAALEYHVVLNSARVHMTSLNGDFILVRDPEGNMLEIFESNG